MTDDELLVLWTLDGWESKYITDFLATEERHWLYRCNRSDLRLVICSIGRNLMFASYDYYVSHSYVMSLLYVVDDFITFNPTERCIKLMLAKNWYKQNKEQFE